VFLFEPAETPYDLRWRMLGTSVRVHPMFWLVTAVFGWDAWFTATGGNLVTLLLWVSAVFVSILVHEFGHVLVGRLFGSHGYIVLYSFGGLAVGSNQLERRWQRIAVLLAGPAAQLVLYLALWLLWPPVAVPAREQLTYSWALQEQLLWINLCWPVLNLLPIFPLDGGQVAREICEGISPSRGTSFALGLSMVVAGVLAIHSFLGRKSPIPYVPKLGMYAGILFALLCVNSFQALQADTARRRQWSSDDRLPWER
jgi:Zn-dependent protease